MCESSLIEGIQAMVAVLPWFQRYYIGGAIKLKDWHLKDKRLNGTIPIYQL